MDNDIVPNSGLAWFDDVIARSRGYNIVLPSYQCRTRIRSLESHDYVIYKNQPISVFGGAEGNEDAS